jgi:hypothetical protein
LAHKTLQCHQTRESQNRFALVYTAQRHSTRRFTPLPISPYTACEAIVKATHFFLSAITIAAAIFLLSAPAAKPRAEQATEQVAPQKPAEKTPEKTQETTQGKPAATPAPKIPAEIELLETRIRFEANGDSRKEVHARVKINDELGARQFARLNFDFNRAFEQIEIPLVRITHASGGTADVLPSAITDTPNPAVVNAPAYQDVRVKSVRILGLEPGDSLEYRVITTVSHHPLAPDFWLDHTFDRTGVVSHEIFELDVPTSRKPDVRINPKTPVTSIDKSGEDDAGRTIYRWNLTAANSAKKTENSSPDSEETEQDVALSTEAWELLSIRLDEKLTPGAKPTESLGTYEESMQELSRKFSVAPEVTAKALELAKEAKTNRRRLEAIYDFVSQKIRTVDLPLSATGFLARSATDVLSVGYATPEDKFVVFAALAAALKFNANAALTGFCDKKGLPRPSVFKHLLISAYDGKTNFWLDPALEVAPFGVIPPNSGKCAFVLNRKFFAMNSAGHEWETLEAPLPFPAKQRVTIDATLSSDGSLSARAKYVIRGENELLLRTAFHQTPRDKWDGVAQLLALSDGFRGKVSKASASDPYETHDPFTLTYEIDQAKFVDWSKKTLNIPAILPLLGLPDPPVKSAPGAAATPIDLGTPLDVEVSATIHLPAGTTAHIPTGTSVARDFAIYTSEYSAKDATVTASRHLNFILKEIPADRAADYNAFLRTIQNDESQTFTLERADTTPAAPKKP